MRQSLPILVAIICLGTIGCGPVMVKPEGRILKKGEPFVAGEGEIVQVSFFPDEDRPEHEPYAAKVKREDGTFQVVGADGRGLPPGKYRATVAIVKNRKDVLKGSYNRTRTPFKFEVTPSSGEITLDLDESKAAAAPASQPGNRPNVRRDAKRR